MKAAVLGKPISHSKSPILHNAGYAALGLDNWQYTAIECDAAQLPTVVSQADTDYVGFSVTMPGKFAALDFANEATPRSQLIGSANTLVRTPRGWRADNTDCDGVIGALKELFATTASTVFGPGDTAVVIGAGGTARPALWALAQLGISAVNIVNRRDRRAEFQEISAAVDVPVTFIDLSADVSACVSQAAVVISTVPSQAIAAENLQVFSSVPLLDVIYDPWPTPLIREAERQQVPAVGGHVMLAHQAYGQFEQFTGQPAPRAAMWQALCQSLGINQS